MRTFNLTLALTSEHDDTDATYAVRVEYQPFRGPSLTDPGSDAHLEVLDDGGALDAGVTESHLIAAVESAIDAFYAREAA